ncbi:site-2 protease family protein [Winogradskyella sp. 4-2091]|uniref:site-2 protease family protein n=1 Tax=Winogradskyella sp. 4-2091 TaxID=3381659 RepID=UPI003891E622
MFKILNAIFPIYFWLILLIGIVVFVNNVNVEIAYLLLNLVAFLFSIKVGVVIHEFGHLIFGKLAGGNPKRIVLGKSHEVKRFTVFNIKIILNKDFNGGFAFVEFPPEKNTKINQFLLSSGGCLTNLIVAGLLLLCIDFSFSFLSSDNGFQFTSAFIFANSLIAIISLIPYHVEYQGVKVPTDGLTLLRLPFKKNNASNVDFNAFFEAQEKFEEKEFDAAIQLYKKYINIEETKVLAHYNTGIMYSKKGDIDEGMSWLESCLNLVDKEKDKMMFAHINNGLAWLKLVKGDTSQIDILSKTAYSIKPSFYYFKGTRGAVLIELGKTEAGIKMLTPLVDFKYPNSQTVTDAIFLYYGHTVLNSNKKAQKFFNFVSNNLDRLGADELLVWKRIQNKLKTTEGL